MALEQRIATLQKRHAELDREILAQTARLSTDDFLLERLKKEKLGLKDTISRLINMNGQQQAA